MSCVHPPLFRVKDILAFDGKEAGAFGSPISYDARGDGFLVCFVKFRAPGVSTTSFVLLRGESTAPEVVYASDDAFTGCYDPEADRLLVAEFPVPSLYRNQPEELCVPGRGRILAVDVGTGEVRTVLAPARGFAPMSMSLGPDGSLAVWDACSRLLRVLGPGGETRWESELGEGPVPALACGPEGEVYALVRADRGYLGWSGSLPEDMVYRIEPGRPRIPVHRSLLHHGLKGAIQSVAWWGGLVVSYFCPMESWLACVSGSGVPLWQAAVPGLVGPADAYAWGVGASGGLLWLSCYSREGWRLALLEKQDAGSGGGVHGRR